MKKLSLKKCSIISGGAGQVVIDDIHVNTQGISQRCAVAIQSVLPKVLSLEVPIETAQHQLAQAGCVKRDYDQFVKNFEVAVDPKKC